MSTTQAPRFTLTIHHREGVPTSAELRPAYDAKLPPEDQEFPTAEAAAEFVKQFPKSRGLKATTIDYTPGKTLTGRMARAGWVVGHINFSADGVNGGRNEAGIKRLRAWLADPRLNITYVGRTAQQFPTLDEALAAVA